jgi:hypothetical protein
VSRLSTRLYDTSAHPVASELSAPSTCPIIARSLQRRPSFRAPLVHAQLRQPASSPHRHIALSSAAKCSDAVLHTDASLLTTCAAPTSPHGAQTATVRGDSIATVLAGVAVSVCICPAYRMANTGSLWGASSGLGCHSHRFSRQSSRSLVCALPPHPLLLSAVHRGMLHTHTARQWDLHHCQLCSLHSNTLCPSAAATCTTRGDPRTTVLVQT